MCNAYGVSLDQGPLSDTAYWTVVKELDTPFYRPATQTIASLAASPAACASCDAAVAEGLKLVLVLANGGPPASVAAYQATVGAALDRWKGAVATFVVEDEPTTEASWSGTPAQYLAELAAGCATAHAHGARCASGGIDSTSMLLLTAAYYEKMSFQSEALRILQAASNNPDIPPMNSDADVQALLAGRAGAIATAQEILAGVLEAGADYANFHWYEADEDTFDEALALVRLLSGCNSNMTDALGGREPSTSEVGFKLNDAEELGLRIVVWASAAPGDAASVADTGGNLTNNGLVLAAATRTADCGQ
jgi:hypothetical protein